MTVWSDAGLTKPSVVSDGAQDAVDAFEYLLALARPSTSGMGEWITDHGAVGDGTDDRAAIVAALAACVASGSRTIILPTPPSCWTTSAAIDLDDYGRHIRVLGVGGGDADGQFMYTQVPITCTESGHPVFTCGNDYYGHGLTLENLYLNGGHALFKNTPTPSSVVEDAEFRFINCGGYPTADGLDGNTNVELNQAFWFNFDVGNYLGPSVETISTVDVTLSSTPTTVTVTSTAGFPSAGYAHMGEPRTSYAFEFKYTGKTGTTLTGCTLVGAGSYPFPASLTPKVKWTGPSLLIRGGKSGDTGVAYLGRFTTLINAGMIEYEATAGAGGGVPHSFRFVDVTMENLQDGVFCITNNSGASMAFHNIYMESCLTYDPLWPGQPGSNVMLHMRGANQTNVQKFTELNCRQTDPCASVMMTHASSTVTGFLIGLDPYDISIIDPTSLGTLTHVLVHDTNGLSIVSGTAASLTRTRVMGDALWQQGGYIALTNAAASTNYVVLDNTNGGKIQAGNPAGTTGEIRVGNGVLINGEGSAIFAKFIQGYETTDGSAPAANSGKYYFRDNGSGKTQFVVRFPTGAVQVLATEP